MADSERKHVLLTLCIAAVVIAGVAVLNMVAETSGFSENMDDVWKFFRFVNYPLGIVATVGVSYRLTMMIIDRKRVYATSGIHLLLWFGYIALTLLITSLSARHYDSLDVPGVWTEGARTMMLFGAIVLTVWWPHQYVEKVSNEEH